MANTYVTFVDSSNAPLTEYTIPFNFFQPEDVKVISDLTTSAGNSLQWTYVSIQNWNSNLVDGETSYQFGTYTVVAEGGVNKIKFSPSRPTNTGGTNVYFITIYRRTSYLSSTYFSNGSPIQASDLNAILLQNIYKLDETIEAVDSINAFDLSSQLTNKVSKTGDTLTGSLYLSETGGISGATTLQLTQTGTGIFAPQVQLQGGTIRNVPTPAYSTDAVNKAYVDALSLPGTPITIADDSVTSEKLRKVAGEEAVTASAIRAGAVIASKIGTNAVTADKIISNAVTALKIASGAVTSAKIATNAVTSVAINAGAVTEDKIGTNAVSNTKLASNAVTNDKILDGTITSAKLANQTLDGTTLIADNSIPSSKLKDSGISWDANTINLNKYYVNSTATEINAPSATIKANNIRQNKTLSYLGSQAVNNGRLALLDGSFKADASVSISSATLQQFDGAIPRFSVVTTPDANGYYFYTITAENPYLLGKPFARTLIKWQGRGSSNPLGSPIGDKKPTFFYKTISNIPFNYVIDNENPEISLNGTPLVPLTTSGEIVFNNTGGSAKKYLITLTGFATSQRESLLYIKAIGDDYVSSSTYAPKAVERIFFPTATLATARKIPFNIKSIFNLSANTNVTFPVQYYYTDDLAVTPDASIACGFGMGIENATAQTGVFAPPTDWMGTSGQGRWNDSIVDLLIERIQ